VNPEITTTGAILAGLAALVTAASAGMARVIAELRKISNGNMQRIDERLAEIAKLERANLMMGGKILRAIRGLGADGNSPPVKKRAGRAEGAPALIPHPSTMEGDGRNDG
jgi:hypothetical protein